jgi:Predicted coiled-coil domain-containing protein
LPRLEESLNKLREVERDREHWRLELQLLTIKLEKHKSEAPLQPEAHLEVILMLFAIP